MSTEIPIVEDRLQEIETMPREAMIAKSEARQLCAAYRELSENRACVPANFPPFEELRRLADEYARAYDETWREVIFQRLIDGIRHMTISMLSAHPAAEPSAQPADAKAGDGMCGCKSRDNCAYIGDKKLVRDGQCRHAAGQPFVEESAGRAVGKPVNDSAVMPTGGIRSEPVPADPVAVDAEIDLIAMSLCKPRFGRLFAYPAEVADAIRIWIKHNGTRNDGLRDAAEVCRKEASICRVCRGHSGDQHEADRFDGMAACAESLTQAIAALSADEKTPAHGGPGDGASGD